MMALPSFTEFLSLPLQTGNSVTSIPVQPRFAVDILTKLLNSAPERVNRLSGLIFLIFKRVTLHLQTLHHRGRNCLFFTQRRQTVFQGLSLCAQFSGLCLGARRLSGFLAQINLGFLPGLIGLFPAAVQQHALTLAQLFANRTVPGRLFGLPRQLYHLTGQLFQHIINPFKIAFGPLEFKLGLMTALIQP